MSEAPEATGEGQADAAEGGAAGGSGERERAALRISADYFMRSLRLLGELHQGELITGMVSLAVVQANIAHLDNTGQGPLYSALTAVPPDELRRPASVLSVANSMGLPYETVRRHVSKLLREGVCRRVKGGVIVPAEVLASPAWLAMVEVNMTNLRRLHRNLARAGVRLD